MEWLIHAPIAAEEGVSVAVIDALKAGWRPNFKYEALVYELSLVLYTSKRERDSTYDKAVVLLGEIGVVDLVEILS